MKVAQLSRSYFSVFANLLCCIVLRRPNKFYWIKVKRVLFLETDNTIKMSLLETENVYLFIPNLIGEFSHKNSEIA